MTIDSRLAHPNGEATATYLHEVLHGSGLEETVAISVATNLAGQFDILAKGEPIAFEDVQVGDTIHAVRECGSSTERCIGVVTRTLGHTLYHQPAYPGPTYALAHDTTEAITELYLLHRPKPAPKQLTDMQPGLVIDNTGKSWVFDGRYAYRAARNSMTSRVPMDEGGTLAPWSQEATLDYNVEAEDAATPDLAEAAGKRTEYGIRFSDGEVKLRPTAYEAVEEARRLSKLRGPDNYVEPVTRINWGSAESAWVVIEVATTPGSGPVKYGVRDHEGQRAWVSRDSIGNLRIGVEEESAYLTQEAADSLIQHLTELAGGA